MLVELSVVEQRYHAVMEVLAGAPVIEVAARYGVSRKTVHAWLNRYAESGLAGLVDRSHRALSHPWRLAARTEAVVVQMRIDHPRWGPRRITHELARAGVVPVPSRSTIYRVLVRNRLVAAKPRRRRREDYRRWQRPGSMQLWQIDIMGSIRLVDGSEAKLISGVDDHSRFNVIAAVVARASSRAVCLAFAGALEQFGVPDQVLTDNGKQFTGKYTRPRPAEVLFDRICRLNGIEHLLTKIRSPTTTGKVERWHQTIQRELLDDLPPFASIAAAQERVDAWRVEYNTTRPHQSLDMACPLDRFTPRSADERARTVLWLPPGLAPVADDATPEPVASVAVAAGVSDDSGEPDGTGAWQLERPVPPSGIISISGQQFWFGPHRAGEMLTFWIDDTTVHVCSNGVLQKTVPCRLNRVELSRLPRAGARPAGPPPARKLPRMIPGAPVEIDRSVNLLGIVSIGKRQIQVGSPLAGQRVTICLDGTLAHVRLLDRTLWRSVAFEIGATARMRLFGARPASTEPPPQPGPARVQRVVSSQGGIQVVNQRVQVGKTHARKIVTVLIGETTLHVYDQQDELLKEVNRTTTDAVTRHKAYRTQRRAVNQT